MKIRNRGLALLTVAFLFSLSCARSGTTAVTAVSSPVPSSAPATTAQAEPTIASSPLGLVVLTEVVDGDTVKARIGGRLESIRVLGIDTPEVADRRRPVQCFGREASQKARQRLDNRVVALIADPTQSNRDKYQRLLRYVEPENEGDFGLWMIANGYAHEYTYRVPYQRQAQYKSAQAAARQQNLGFWSASTCNGDTVQPATKR